MTNQELEIYKTIFSNSILFLKRGIKEIVSHDDLSDKPLTNEIAIISTLFIQMSIELALKAFLIKEKGIRSILEYKYHDKTDEMLYAKFENNTLKTRFYHNLKDDLKNDFKEFTTTANLFDWNNEYGIAHLDKFQRLRNKLVHINLFLENEELYNIKYESIYVIAHIIVSFLTEIDYECETTSDFYNKYLDKDDYIKLINYPIYIEEMEKIALKYGGLIYNCPNCNNKTYSIYNEICYCCNINLTGATAYINCTSCNSNYSVIYDKHNIEINGNIINGLCLNCEEKPNIYRCPDCESVYLFYNLDDLIECKPNICFYTK